MIDLPSIVSVVGPTASGKTSLGIKLAQKFNGEIINADSRQVYAELKIGVARPAPEEFGAVPHHLFASRSIQNPWDAATFVREASTIIADIHRRGKLPIVVGGTGLYVRALLFGLFEGPARDAVFRDDLEKRIESEGLPAVYAELERKDPAAAAKIHANDALRIIRALEVLAITDKPISRQQEEHAFLKPRYRYLKLALEIPRETLYDRINQRVEQMMREGLKDEVQALYQSFGRQAVLDKAIGYREWFDHFDGAKKLDAVLSEIQQNSRNFAKRQLTWFRNEEDVVWIMSEDAAFAKVKIFTEE